MIRLEIVGEKPPTPDKSVKLRLQRSGNAIQVVDDVTGFVIVDFTEQGVFRYDGARTALPYDGRGRVLERTSY